MHGRVVELKIVDGVAQIIFDASERRDEVQTRASNVYRGLTIINC